MSMCEIILKIRLKTRDSSPEENYLFEIALSRLQSKYSQTLKNGLTEREEMLLKEYIRII